MNRRAAAVLLTAALLFPAACKSRNSSDAYAQAEARPTAPDFTLGNLEGKAVSLKDFSGQVVLVDFWATWCPPCRESIPALKKLQKDYDGKGMQVLGVSLDEDPALVSSFVKKNDITYTVLLGGDSDVSEMYQVRGIPTMYLLSREGKVVRHWVGFDSSYPGEWRETIDKLLAS